MSAELFKQVFQLTDPATGELKSFETKAEALDFLRKPKVMEALSKATNGNAELSTWIYEHQELLEDVFSTGTIQRVKKAEYKQLKAALEAIKVADNKAYKFVADNADAIYESFRWPTVKRVDEAEKAKQISQLLLTATENNKGLVDWIVASKDKIFEAFEAGKIKREVSPKATEGLAVYRAQMAEKKLAAEQAAADAEGLSLEDYRAKLENEKIAKQAEKDAKKLAESAPKAEEVVPE
jgi:hypothetical protein